MGIITKEVEVKPTGKMIQYYKDKGYDAKHKQSLFVKTEDLPEHSDKIVEVLCDYCKETVSTIKYSIYTKSLKNIPKYACKKCMYQKLKDVNQLLFGVDNYGQTQEYAKKIRKVSLEKYGVEHYASLESVKKKREMTTYERYHVKNYSETVEFHKKMEKTSMLKYNTKNPSQSEIVKVKAMKTNIQKYGVPWTMQCPEVREKANKTFCENGTQKTSLQQLYLHSLYSGEINYPISYYAIDICFPDDKLCIEYDGGGHRLRVELGLLTEQEFDQKEIIRNNIIKRKGYKQMRIISSKDYLPSDETLLQLLSHSKKYFSETSHTWISWDIDNSKMINAENKDSDGVFFDFGKLRKIKKSDIEKLSNNVESA